MRRGKKIWLVLLMLAMAVSMAACGGGGDEGDGNGDGNSDAIGEKVVLHMGGGLNSSSPQFPALESFRDEVYELSGGTIEISLDLAGAHGSDREIIEGVMNGSLAMMHMADISIGTVIPEVGYVNLPYLFPDRETAEDTYLNGWIGDAVKEKLAENKLVVIGNLVEGDFRWMTNSKNPIQTPDDLKNLKMRVVESPMYVKFFELIGTQPVGMSVSEVAAALQQGVIDGQDNGPLNTYFYGFYEFQPYLTKTNHAYAANMLCINEDVLATLSEEQQEILLTSAAKWTALAHQYQVDAIEGFCDEMAEAGTELLETTPELDAFIKEAAMEVWADESITANYDQAAMERIRSEFSVE